jgi:hypothetical protein
VKVRITGSEDECRTLAARLPEIADVQEVSRRRLRRDSALVSVYADVTLTVRQDGRFVPWGTDEDRAAAAAAVDGLDEQQQAMIVHHLVGYMPLVVLDVLRSGR